MKQELEIIRRNCTLSEFFAYGRRRCKLKNLPCWDWNIRYFENGNDFNFDKAWTDGPNKGLYEKSVVKPYQYQCYVKTPDGTVFNEICEFDFYDDKKGVGYYYFLNVD